jgi:flagellar assembly protein FliH
VTPLEYPLLECVAPAILTLLAAEEAALPVDAEPQMTHVAEEEMQQRVEAARNAAVAEAEERLREEVERVRQDAQQRMSEALGAFEQDRQAYFKRVEHEVVKFSLAIARKILHREAEIEPSLVAALVRRALERMQCGGSVRVRVASAEAESWRERGEEKNGAPRWEIVVDSALKPGDCIVETSVGSANFGLDAQLNEVEESLLQLLAQSPAA